MILYQGTNYRYKNIIFNDNNRDYSDFCVDFNKALSFKNEHWLHVGVQHNLYLSGVNSNVYNSALERLYGL